MGTRSGASKADRTSGPPDTALLPAGTEPVEAGPCWQSAHIEDLAGIRVETRILRLKPGLCALGVADSRHRYSRHAGLALPAIHITAPPPQHGALIEIVGSNGNAGCWFGADGGTVVIKAPPEGGCVLITSYERKNDPIEQRAVSLGQINPPLRPGDSSPTAPLRPARIIAVEAVLHIERTGDCRVPAEGWIGSRGKNLRIEAFSIRPLEMLAPSEIEYRAFGPSGRETEWVSDGRLCGTRGRSLPLTGFAIRLATHQAGRFGVEYRGSFFESGICGPIRDGAACMPRILDDPLEAINLRLFERADS